MKDVGLEPNELESLVVDRSSWRSLSKRRVQTFEQQLVNLLQEKRTRRKGQIEPHHSSFQCDLCGEICASRITLFHIHEFICDEILLVTDESHKKSYFSQREKSYCSRRENPPLENRINLTLTREIFLMNLSRLLLHLKNYLY